MSRPTGSLQASDVEVSTAASLQPMGFTDILDCMFSLYRNHFRLFASICSVFFVIALAAQLLDGISALLLSSVDDLSRMSGVHDLVFLVTAVVVILAMSAAICSLFFGATQVYLGKPVTASAAFRQTKRRFWQFVVSGLLYGIVIQTLILLCFLGLDLVLDLLALRLDLLFLSEIFLPETVEFAVGAISILAAVYLGVRWIFCSLAAVFEEKSAVRSLKRSSELVKGGWWRVFGVVMGIFLLTLFILNIFSLSWGLISGVTGDTQDDEELPKEDANPLSALVRMFALNVPEPTSWGSFAQYAIWCCLGYATYCLTLPVGVIGITLVYFDRRIRKEGFDIEMLVTSEDA